MSGNGNGGGGNGGNGGGGTYGGTPIVPTNLIPASTTVLQPGSRYFRLVDAFAQLDQTLAVDTLNNDITALQASVATLQGQVSTLQSQMTTVQGQITTLQGQATAFTAFMATFNYQQVEVSTGSYYLDNRTIYRRSFVISNALNTALNVFTYPHLIPAINYIADVQAMASVATGQQLPITFANFATSPNITVGLGCWADTTNIYISVGNTVFTNYLTLVTLWYTATNR